MAAGKRRLSFSVSEEFDLSALVSALRRATWKARRIRARVTRGAVVDTAGRELLSAGLAAVEEGPGKRRRISVWLVPLGGATGPQPLFEIPSTGASDLAGAVSGRLGLRLSGELLPLAGFERESVPFDMESTAGRVRVNFETLRALEGSASPRTYLGVELTKGDRETLALVSGLVRLQGGVGPEVSDGPLQVLSMLGVRTGPPTEPRIRVRRSMSGGEAAVSILRRNFDNLVAKENGARVGLDDEFVHDMRVCTRRMREALRMFSSVFVKGSTKRLVDEMRWLASVLGAVRDLDVYMAMVPQYLSLVQWEPPDFAFYLEDLDKRRLAARVKLTAALDGARYARFKREMSKFLADAPLSSGARGLKFMAKKRLKSLSQRAIAAGNKARTDEELHSARIVFKRLRYAAEFAAGLAPKPLGKLAGTAKSCQDVLGAHQDAAVACGRVQEAIGLAKSDSLKAFLLGYLFACQRLSAINAKGEFFESWRGKRARSLAAAARAASSRL